MLSLPLVILLKVIHRCVSTEPQETFSGEESASAICNPEPFLERGPINGHEHFEYLAPPQCYEKIEGAGVILLGMLYGRGEIEINVQNAVREILKKLKKQKKKQKKKGADLEKIETMQNDLQQVIETPSQLKDLKEKNKISTTFLDQVVKTCQHLLYEIGFIHTWPGKKPQLEMEGKLLEYIPEKKKKLHKNQSPVRIGDFKSKVFTEQGMKVYNGMRRHCATFKKYYPRASEKEQDDINKWCKPFSHEDRKFWNAAHWDSMVTVLEQWFDNTQILKTKKRGKLVKKFNGFLSKATEIFKTEIEDELIHKLEKWDIETLVGFKENDELSLQDSKANSNRSSYLNMAYIRNGLSRQMVKNSNHNALEKLHKCTISHYNTIETSAKEWIVTTGITDKTYLKSFISQNETGSVFHFLLSFTRQRLRNTEDRFDVDLDLISMENLAGIDFTGSVDEGRKGLGHPHAKGDYVRNMRKVLYGSVKSDGENKTENPTQRNNEGFQRFVEQSNTEKKLFFRVHMYENLNYSGNGRTDPFYKALYEVLFDPIAGLMTDTKNESWLKRVTFVIGHSNTIMHDSFMETLIGHQDKVAGIQINWNIASNQFIQDSYSYKRTCRQLLEIKKQCNRCKVILGSDGIGIMGTKASIQSQREYIKSENDQDASTQAGNKTRKYGRNNDNARSNSPSLKKRIDPQEQITE